MIESSSLKFGTSGLRGLSAELQGPEARRYVAAFLRHLQAIGQVGRGRVYLGRDFRQSSPAIVRDCATSIAAAGLTPIDCGPVPTPALALHAMADMCPAIMVTGSHIPEDRNGLKFYLPTGEIGKADELGILSALRDDDVGVESDVLDDQWAIALERYRDRFAGLLPAGALSGLRIGVFEHSTVGRDVLGEILRAAGAETVSLGRIDGFVAVDTEAFDDEVFKPLSEWLRTHRLDAIVSADGDADRPLLMADDGQFVRGDVLGLLTARFLGADSVVTPVTSNSAIERTGYFGTVVRTRVGSPYVVAEMESAPRAVVGFEANGGTLVGDGFAGLPALPTRDAVLPLLATLGLAARGNVRVSALVAELPLQCALASRIQDVPSEASSAFLGRLKDDQAYADAFFAPHGIAGLSTIDGPQFRTQSGDMVHFRASGNAPELRCYVEGSTPQVAESLLTWAIRAAAKGVGRSAD